MSYSRNIINFIISRRIHLCKARYVEKVSSNKSDVKTDEIFFHKPITSKLDLNLLPPKIIIDAATISLLEKLSLVDCANKESIKVLEDAIEFADQILQVDTTGIEPLVTVLEDRPLEIREDTVSIQNIRDNILLNAAVTEEEYFVAPPGNIPLEPRENLLHVENNVTK